MTKLPLHPGQQFNHFFQVTIWSLIFTTSCFLFFYIFPLSKGEIYQNRLSLWRFLVKNSSFTRADELAKHLDPVDLNYFGQKYHPRYISKLIGDILKKTNRSTDDLIEISLLYYQIGDQENSRHFLLLAQEQDPIRSDIDQLLHKLF